MKAVTYHQFGPVENLRLEEIAAPSPGPGEVLVAMRATSVNVVDIRSRRGEMAPFVNGKFPKTPGADVAGVVTAVGEGVTAFRSGDHVFGATNPFKGGAFAELVKVPARQLAALPDKMSFEEGAALPVTGAAAFQALGTLGKVRAGDDVLIYGSSGSAGLYAIQLAKGLGARVTAVSGTRGVLASKAAGADEALDYKAGPVTLKRQFDVIVEFSSQFTFRQARPHLKPSGRYVDSSPTIPKVIGSLVANVFRSQKNLMLMGESRTAELTALAGMVTDGRLRVTIAARYPLSDAAAAFRDQERGGTIGKIVVMNESAQVR
jgi:NADPH:quinone reductase-like Zn-dependent oxidoreductase